MKKRTTIVIVICVICINLFIFSMWFFSKSAIDAAIELGKLPFDRDTSVYLRVYEDNGNRFYLNGHLIDFKDLEKRADKLGPGNGLIYYSNQTPSKKIPKESKIFNLLKEKQIGFVTYHDSVFTRPYH